MSRYQHIIDRIKNGDEQEVMALYQQYKNNFVGWASNKFHLDRDNALDIFQDVVIDFYNDIKQGKLTEIRYSIKTLLFSIAKNKIYNKLRYEKKFDVDHKDFEGMEYANTNDDKLELSERKRIMVETLEQLGEPCHAILKLFYFDDFSMDAIAQTLEYKNADVVKSQKLRCLNQLRQQIMKHFNHDDL